MIDLTLDSRDLPTREALHDALARGLSLPPWYGRNLDALFDCLTSLPEPAVLRIRSASGFPSPFLDLLRRAASENPDLTVIFDDPA